MEEMNARIKRNTDLVMSQINMIEGVMSYELFSFVEKKSGVRGLNTLTTHQGVHILEDNSRFQTQRFIDWMNGHPTPFLRIAVVHKGSVTLFCTNNVNYAMAEIGLPDGDVWSCECFCI